MSGTYEDALGVFITLGYNVNLTIDRETIDASVFGDPKKIYLAPAPKTRLELRKDGDTFEFTGAEIDKVLARALRAVLE